MTSHAKQWDRTVKAQPRSSFELRSQDGSIAATVLIPTTLSTGALLTLHQRAFTAAEMKRLAKVLVRTAEKLDRRT